MKTSAYRQAAGLLFTSESMGGVSEEEANRRDTQQVIEWTVAGRKDRSKSCRTTRNDEFSEEISRVGRISCRFGWGPAEARVFDQL